METEGLDHLYKNAHAEQLLDQCTTCTDEDPRLILELKK